MSLPPPPSEEEEKADYLPDTVRKKCRIFWSKEIIEFDTMKLYAITTIENYQK